MRKGREISHLPFAEGNIVRSESKENSTGKLAQSSQISCGKGMGAARCMKEFWAYICTHIRNRNE